MNVVDELFPHHDDEELLSQLDQTAPWTTLQPDHTRRTNHTINHNTHKCTEQMRFGAAVISANVHTCEREIARNQINAQNSHLHSSSQIKCHSDWGNQRICLESRVNRKGKKDYLENHCCPCETHGDGRSMYYFTDRNLTNNTVSYVLFFV